MLDKTIHLETADDRDPSDYIPGFAFTQVEEIVTEEPVMEPVVTEEPYYAAAVKENHDE